MIRVTVPGTHKAATTINLSLSPNRLNTSFLLFGVVFLGLGGGCSLGCFCFVLHVFPLVLCFLLFLVVLGYIQIVVLQWILLFLREAEYLHPGSAAWMHFLSV